MSNSNAPITPSAGLLNSLFDLGKNKLFESFINNPQQVANFMKEFAMKSPQIKAFCKGMDWDINNLVDTGTNIVLYGVKSYKERKPFAATEETRSVDFVEKYTEICKFKSFTEDEAKILAAGLARYNDSEIIKAFHFESRYKNEDIRKIAEEAYIKLQKLSEQSNIGVVGTNIEKPVVSDLDTLARKISNGEKVSP